MKNPPGEGGLSFLSSRQSGDRKRILHGSELHFLLEFHDVLAEETVGVHKVFDGLTGVDDGGMVPAAEVFTNGFEGIFGESFGQVHSDLPRLNDFAFAGFLQ